MQTTLAVSSTILTKHYKNATINLLHTIDYVRLGSRSIKRYTILMLDKKNRLVLGSFEPVSIPGLGIHNMIAKIDTGAYSGALHCSSIKEVVRHGQKVLQFTPSENDVSKQELVNYTTVYVRSSNGHRVRRFVIDATIILRAASYPIKIGLSDRSDMKREILIGRRFLRENKMLVDVTLNQEYDTDGVKKI